MDPELSRRADVPNQPRNANPLQNPPGTISVQPGSMQLMQFELFPDIRRAESLRCSRPRNRNRSRSRNRKDRRRGRLRLRERLRLRFSFHESIIPTRAASIRLVGTLALPLPLSRTTRTWLLGKPNRAGHLSYRQSPRVFLTRCHGKSRRSQLWKAGRIPGGLPGRLREAESREKAGLRPETAHRILGRCSSYRTTSKICSHF